MPIRQEAALKGLVVAYGTLTMAGQVLILRELLVLCQGQELKLALGLWCWLLLTGLGSLVGGRLATRFPANLETLGNLLFLLACCLPGTVLGARLLPGLLSLPVGQSLGPGAALLLFTLLLAPFGLISGGFFPFACQVQRTLNPLGVIGRIYATEALGAAAGIGLLQVFLIGRFANLSLSLGAGLTALALAGLLTRRLNFLFGLMILGVGLYFSPHLDLRSRQWQWPQRQVLASVDSPYALLTATREQEQLSFFANHVWHFSHPDAYSAEHAVHLALLEHPCPQRVLLLGGGVAGLAPQILKHPSVTHLHYVEPDPDLVRLAARLVTEAAHAVADPRVVIFHRDARRFLSHTDIHYDVMILALPEPTSAQLNRYYSREFFRLAARHLDPQGVISLALGSGGGISLNPERAAYLALIQRTLQGVFPEVLVFPGDPVRFFASPSPEGLTANPEILVQRLRERRLELLYVREYYLLADLAPSRQQYLQAILQRQPAEVNTDLNPRGFFYDLILTGSRESLPLKAVLVGLGNLPGIAPWLALGLVFSLTWLFTRRHPGVNALFQVLVMGVGTMALEILTLVLYQVYLGYIYQHLGLLIASFMLGLAAGGAWFTGRRPEARLLAHPLAGLQLTLAGLALGLLILLAFSGDFLWTPPEILLQTGFLLFLALAGGAGGGIFSLSAMLWLETRPSASLGAGLFYAVDLFGATLGTLALSLVILPLYGIIPALAGLAALHAGAAILVLSH